MIASFQDGNGRWVTPPDRVEYRFGAKRGTLVEVEEPQPSGSSEQGDR